MSTSSKSPIRYTRSPDGQSQPQTQTAAADDYEYVDSKPPADKAYSKQPLADQSYQVVSGARPEPVYAKLRTGCILHALASRRSLLAAVLICALLLVGFALGFLAAYFGRGECGGNTRTHGKTLTWGWKWGWEWGWNVRNREYWRHKFAIWIVCCIRKPNHPLSYDHPLDNHVASYERQATPFHFFRISWEMFPHSTILSFMLYYAQLASAKMPQ